MAKKNLETAIAEIIKDDVPGGAEAPQAGEASQAGGAEAAPADDNPPAGTEEAPAGGAEEASQTEDNPPAPAREDPAQHAYRRQLEKQEARHKQELAELNANWEKKFAELKSGLPQPPAEQPKSRKDFPDDDSYIAYLVDEGMKKKLGERDAEAAKKAAEQAEAAKAQQAEEAELEHQRAAWQATVDGAFGTDASRKEAFLKRVAYCNDRGLGKVLEGTPVATNYLMGSTTGVKVFEKILSDVDTMKRIFNDRTASDPFEMFWQLKTVEQEVLAAEKAAQTPPPAASPAAPAAAPAVTLPHGRPGRQAAGNSEPNIWDDPKAMKEFLRSH